MRYRALTFSPSIEIGGVSESAPDRIPSVVCKQHNKRDKDPMISPAWNQVRLSVMIEGDKVPQVAPLARSASSSSWVSRCVRLLTPSPFILGKISITLDALSCGFLPMLLSPHSGDETSFGDICVVAAMALNLFSGMTGTLRAAEFSERMRAAYQIETRPERHQQSASRTPVVLRAVTPILSKVASSIALLARSLVSVRQAEVAIVSCSPILFMNGASAAIQLGNEWYLHALTMRSRAR